MTAPTPRRSHRRIKSLLNQYLESGDFWALQESTRAEYRRLTGVLRDEVGERTLAHVNRRWVASLQTEWMSRGHRATALRLQILRNALKPAIDEGHILSSIFAGHKPFERRLDLGDRNFAWNELEFESVIDECWRRQFLGLLLAVGLSHYAQVERNDLCNLPASARIERTLAGGGVEQRLYYARADGRIVLDMIEPAELTELFEQTGGAWLPTLVYSKKNQPMRLRGLNQALDRITDYLEKWGVARRGLTLTGLRKTLVEHNQSRAAQARLERSASAMANPPFGKAA